MDSQTLLAWVLIIGFGGVIFLFRYLLGKGVNVVARTANRNILYRSEYEEGKRIISEPLVVRTKLPVSDIIRELSAHVTTAELPLTFNAVVYQAECNESKISYAFGNKFKPLTFLSTISFKKVGTETECVFKMIKWWEKNGLITGQPYMEKLRKQVQQAFVALENPAKSIIEGNEENVFCPNCGTPNILVAKFCKSCGNKI